MQVSLGTARPLISDRSGIRVDAWYCNTYDPLARYFLGNSALCVPTDEDLRAWQTKELTTTQLTPENQAAAVAAGDAAIAADRASHPEDACSFDAVSQSPWLSQIFGPDTVCKVSGGDPSGGMLSLLLAAGVGIGFLALIGALKR